ncbi:hypothetical protein ACO2Q0_02515 [Phenylobacterium sp. VNQ135]|uniref:hypothetical protein n=1 Tax=Phenylobacterium sp. VNQ135 TaxID=3400922 RepID=UPI003C056F99
MEQATVKTVEHAEASRLPEPQWFWRRWLIYGCTVASLVILSAVVWAVLRHVPPHLPTYQLIIRYSFYTVWAAVLLYGVGASVTDVAQLVSAVRTTRKETLTTAPPPVAIQTPAATVKAGEPERSLEDPA